MSQKTGTQEHELKAQKRKNKKQQNFIIDCQKTCTKNKGKTFQNKTLQAGFFAGAN